MRKNLGYFFFLKALFLSLCGINQAQRKSSQRAVVDGEGGRGYALWGDLNSCFTLDPDAGWLDSHVWWWHISSLAIMIFHVVSFLTCYLYSYIAHAHTNGIIDSVEQLQAYS